MVESRSKGAHSVVSNPSPSLHAKPPKSTGPSKLMRRFALTDRQHETLAAIRRHVKTHGFPPSRSELCKALNITNHSAVNGHLNALARKGWVRLIPVDRGIQLLREGAPILDADELPAVAARQPHHRLRPARARPAPRLRLVRRAVCRTARLVRARGGRQPGQGRVPLR